MKLKMFDHAAEKTFIVVFDKGDQFIAALTALAKERNFGGAHFTAIGAFQNVTLGYFDRTEKAYQKILVNEQVEVLSLIGDIALAKGAPKVHAHVVVGKSDGTAHGGHILEATVWPTLEVVLTDTLRHLRRQTDEETGLALIDLDASATRDSSPVDPAA